MRIREKQKSKRGARTRDLQDLLSSVLAAVTSAIVAFSAASSVATFTNRVSISGPALSLFLTSILVVIVGSVLGVTYYHRNKSRLAALNKVKEIEGPLLAEVQAHVLELFSQGER